MQSRPNGETTDSMSDAANRIVQKLWSYCNVLRDDGLSYQDYLEQLTFLLFLKMADERARLTGEEEPIPKGYRWADLAAPQMEGVELEQHYRSTLRELGLQGGMLGLIFEKAQNRIQDPAKLRQLIVELPARGPRIPEASLRAGPRPEEPPALRGAARRGAGAQRRTAVRNEPLLARHRSRWDR
jgi:hypothetical protein